MLWFLAAFVAVAGSVVRQRRRAPDAADRTTALIANLVTSLGPGFTSRSSFRTLQRRVLAGALRLRTISVNGVVRVPGALDVAVSPEDRATIAPARSTFLSDVGAAVSDRAGRAGWQIEGSVDLRLVVDDDLEPGRPLVTRRVPDSGEPDVPEPPARRMERVPRTVALGTTHAESCTAHVGTAARATLLLRPETEGLEAILVQADRSPVVVGRRAEPGARAGLDSVSARHCRFERGHDGWTVADLGSKNGTFVNGLRISEPTPVGRGDVVQLGPAAVFRCA
jgi:FHA domain-containing protein